MATKRNSARKRTREDWIRAAASALGSGGWSKVRVEPLAKALGVTKGSFYWHFKDRDALLRAVIDAWEERDTLAIIDQVDDAASAPDDRLRALFRTSVAGDPSVELAIRDLATRHPETRASVARVDDRRMAYLRANFRALGGSNQDAEARSMLFYSLLIGDSFIVAKHGRFARRTILNRAVELLLDVDSDGALTL